MKFTLILALAGLGAAAPAGLLKTSSEDSFVKILPNLLSSVTEGMSAATPVATTLPIVRAEFNDTDSSDDEAKVSAGPVSTATQTSLSAAPSATGNRTDSLDEDLESFQMDPTYSRLAKEQSDMPYPYELVIENYNKTAIHQAIETHRSGVSDDDYDAYEASECAQYCNEHRACDAFAIYIERDASCTDCSDPEAIDVAKCDLYNTALKQPDMRKEAEQESIQGQTITRAVRAYNGYNKIQKTATVTAVRTATVQTSIVAYSTVTVTTTSPVTSTMHHTMSGSNSTVTRTVPAHAVTFTRPATTVTETYVEMAPPVTVTRTSTKSTATVTETSTRSSSVKPTTATVTSTKTTSVEPTTVKPTATLTKTATETSTESVIAVTTEVVTIPTPEAEADSSDSEGEVLRSW
ncbi:hypothetical protein E8E11_010515 [Didymella keratinophila]|nr:hypothetical protein E8E11_010515 [Didymella keratinophila]